jgi:hypothetical protein
MRVTRLVAIFASVPKFDLDSIPFLLVDGKIFLKKARKYIVIKHV